MRWLLLLLAVLVLACAEKEEKDQGPAVSVPVQPQPETPKEVQPERGSEPQKVEGVSVRELLPANVMDYTNFTFHCATGFCSGLYRSRLLGNNNSVQVDFSSGGNVGCGSGIRLSETQKNRTMVWCNGTNTKEKFVSRLWWSEPGMGYVSIVSEERTRSFSDSTRLKNSDFAANNTAQYIIGRLDYLASAGKKIVIAEA